MADFVHLHNHSEYSLLDGLAKIEELVAKTKALGMEALALTDHGVMYGVHYFYVACVKQGIKPILGCEIYMARKTRFDRDPQKDKKRFHLVVLAKSNEGYKNLMRLVTAANLEGFYYKPRVDWELLEKYKQDLILTSACMQGEIPQALLENDFKKAEEITKKFLDLFKDNFYLEIQRHEGKEAETFEKVNKGILQLSQKFGIPVIATNDIHYVNKEDAEAQDALIAIGTKKLVKDLDRMSMIDSPSYYLKSKEEMSSLFADYPEAVKNTVDLAKKCNVSIKLGQRIMPIFPIPEGLNENEYLKKHTHEKAKTRFPNKYESMKERLDYELGVIIDKGYASYFLIYEDFTQWSKDHGIRIGPGRGSAAGSLVSYVLNITTIDPIKYDLPFERFLNPSRPTPPDIDMDFADERREETIEYVRKKYGEDKVAQIITFGKMEARAAIRDIGRVLGFPYSDPDRLAKLIPFGTSIKTTIETVTEFRQEYKDPELKKLIDLAMKVEGNIRHASIHAAALVVAPKPFTEYCPLQKDEKNEKIVTQYDMHGLDCNVDDNAIGLLKMDFLGLRTLSILQRSLDLIKKLRGIDVDIDQNLDMDDQAVYKMLSEGETTGVFQMESAGMRRVARNLKPNKFSDIAALVALYRPGPMDLIDDFIAGKENPDQIKYPHEDLKGVLAETYGIAVYQEQCLSIANIMAGYSLGEADILRRAIGKKQIDVMKKEKEKFTKGAKAKGYSENVIETVWGYIEKFAGYGFNKSHSVSYGMIAYQTAWMKVHYPVEFMTALMTCESANTDKITVAIEECKRMGIKVLPPDINKSRTNFAIETDNTSLNKQAIRFGLSAIKNVGEAAIENIINTKKEKGKFISLSDFFNRVDNQKVNKKVIESLIQVGAFDQFGKRAAILSGYENIRQKTIKNQTQKASGQVGLFDLGEEEEEENLLLDELPEVEELDQQQLLALEKQLLGFYLSDNPILKKMQLIKNAVSFQINEIDPQIHSGNQAILGGNIASIRKVFTKKNNSEMAFATLEDQTGTIDMVIFPKTFQTCKNLLFQDKVILCEGKIDYREDQLCLVVNQISEVKEGDMNFLNSQKRTIEITIPRGTSKFILEKINNLFKENLGQDQIILLLPNGGDIPKKIVLPYKVNYSKKLEKLIKNLLK
ncbi:DNA polymerase III subunit alpha [Candidatus Beckwithbacteria bacterium]|nr:DNA polymerase III subunit alpha [Candidatus Beckwithbacteria bacterium]